MFASASVVTARKFKVCMDPLGKQLFPLQDVNYESVTLRSHVSDKNKTPVPGNDNPTLNIVATTWNEIPELRAAH